MKTQILPIDSSGTPLRPMRWMAWVALLLGLGLTLFGWHMSGKNAQRLAQSRFDARADELHAAIQSRLIAYAQVLRGGQAYVGATGHPTLSQWARLYQTLNITENYPGITGIVYIRPTPQAELEAMLTSTRQEQPEFTIRPPGERPYYMVVTAVEPRSPSNLPVIGSDSWVHLERRQMLEQARDTGENRITGKLNLVIDDPKKPIPAFLMYQAVYQDGKTPVEATERRNQLLGFVCAGFRIDALMLGTLGNVPNDVALRVYDSDTPDEKQLFHASHPGHDFGLAAFTRQRSLSVGGRVWAVNFASLPDFEAEVNPHDQMRWLLAGGILTSLLIFAIVWSLATTRARAIQLAHQITRSLRTSEAKLHELFAQAPVGIAVMDERSQIVDCNEKLAEYIGASREKIIGFNMLEQAQDPILKEPIRRALAGETVSLDVPYTSTMGNRSAWFRYHFQPVTIDGAFAFLLSFAEDITDRKAAEAQIEYQANHDPLTGLPNRLLLRTRLTQQMAGSVSNSQCPFALLFIDLDNFKNVNDSVGHTLGDTLLITVAERLQGCIGESDTLARMGGDEFVILLGGAHSLVDYSRIAQNIIATTALPVVLETRTFNVTASIGIAVWPGDGGTPELLIRNADLAMYQAKKSGRNNVQFFAAEMNTRIQEAIELEGALRVALDRGEFRLYFQPQVSAHNGQIVGAEALIRWQHPQLGMVPPIRFIPLAEERGLIDGIGNWVLREACRQARSWQTTGLPSIPVAVNISAVQFRRGSLRENIFDALEQAELEPRYLAIELTESVLMDDIDGGITLLNEIEAMGVAIEIDDFGTGYSSLSYLKRLPIHRLKIDQSFVRGIPHDHNDAAIVQAIISLASSLNMATIAEGVETAEQAAYLLQLGCFAMQGYHYARPLPAEQFAALLKAGKIEHIS